MDKFAFYRKKAKDACKSEIKKFHDTSRSFFMARLGKKEMVLLGKELEYVKTQTISKLMMSLSLKEHFEIRHMLDDESEIKSLPNFFESCLYQS
jgi:hypothetical protein